MAGCNGRRAIMAGVRARQAVLNHDPVHDRAAFASAAVFERWKLAEVENLEAQKQQLVQATDVRLSVTIHAVRASESHKLHRHASINACLY